MEELGDLFRHGVLVAVGTRDRIGIHLAAMGLGIHRIAEKAVLAGDLTDCAGVTGRDLDPHHEQQAAQPDRVLVTQARRAEGECDDLCPVGGIVIIGRCLFQGIGHARFILELGLGSKQHLKRLAVRRLARPFRGRDAFLGRGRRGFGG